MDVTNPHMVEWSETRAATNVLTTLHAVLPLNSRFVLETTQSGV